MTRPAEIQLVDRYNNFLSLAFCRRPSQSHAKSRFSYHEKGLFLEGLTPVLESRGLFLSERHGSLVAS